MWSESTVVTWAQLMNYHLIRNLEKSLEQIWGYSGVQVSVFVCMSITMMLVAEKDVSSV